MSDRFFIYTGQNEYGGILLWNAILYSTAGTETGRFNGEISYDDAETLEKAGLIKLRGMDKRGNPIYIPVPKDPTKPILMTR